MKIKVCGMKHNTAEVLQLEPDYLGFIFYEKSPRDVSNATINSFNISANDNDVKRVGVFVNASISFILEKSQAFHLDVIQLHGDESAQFCFDLKNHIEQSLDTNTLQLWKVFGIKDEFDFTVLQDYETYIDAFLFDTKGKERGGNGYTFNWKVLEAYPSKKPIILSGGIGIEHTKDLHDILKTNLPIKAIDVNSKFEDKPGLKNIETLSTFIKAIAPLRK